MCPVSRCRRGLRRDLNGSALPTLPQSVSRGARFSRLHWFAFATACQVARPPGRIGPSSPGPPGPFTSRLPAGRSPFPPLDMTTTSSGLLCWRDFHPQEWQLASLHQNLIAEPEAVHDLRSKILQHHISLFDEAQEDLFALGRFEIDGDGLLACVDGDKRQAHQPLRHLGVCAEPSREVAAFRVLNLDDLRPKANKMVAAERPSEDVGQVEDPDPSKRKRHIPTPSFWKRWPSMRAQTFRRVPTNANTLQRRASRAGRPQRRSGPQLWGRL